MNLKKYYIRLFILITILFVCIGIFVYLIVNRITDNKFQKSLYSSMDVALAAVNPDRIKNIINESMNPESADYLRVKDQLTRLGKALSGSGIDSLYIVEKKDEQFVFLADSFDPGNPRFSSPGSVYRQPPPELKDVFQYKSAFLSNPYSDEFGSFVSFFKPITVFDTGDLVGVMGVDIDQAYYQGVVYQNLIWPMLSVLTLYLVAIIFWIFYMRRFRSREQLEDARQLLTGVINSIPDIFFLIDKDLKFILWNKTLENIVGYRHEQVLGAKLTDLFFKADVNILNEAIADVYSRKTTSLEMPIKGKGNKRLSYEFVCSLVLDSDGQVSGIAGLGRDVSSRHQKEEELIAQKKQMEQINKLMVGRELKMIELKKELDSLKKV